MQSGHRGSYQAQEFAQLAGVTVRTLHHYDRLGLLKPAKRSLSGYRLYSYSDLVRLEQIVVLRYLGLPLKNIRSLLDGPEQHLGAVLHAQRRALEEKRKRIDMAILAIHHAEQQLAAGETPESEILQEITKVIEMEKNMDWVNQYYSEEAKEAIESRKHLWSPELQERVSKQWADLTNDVKAAIADGEEPSSPRVQELAARWKKLGQGFTGGNPEITAGLRKMYADRANWPESMKGQISIDEEVFRFMGKALGAC